MKTCPKCNITKTRDEFYTDPARRDGLRSWCKTCTNTASIDWQKANPLRVSEIRRKSKRAVRQRHPDKTSKRDRQYNLKSKYGISQYDYDQIWEAQSGLCAICGHTDFKTLSVDHDHHTGIVRGLLCTNCNQGLGKFKDNPNLLISAVAYLHLTQGAE